MFYVLFSFLQYLFNSCTCMLELNFHKTFSDITVTATDVPNLRVYIIFLLFIWTEISIF